MYNLKGRNKEKGNFFFLRRNEKHISSPRSEVKRSLRVLPSHPTVFSSWRSVNCRESVAEDDKEK